MNVFDLRRCRLYGILDLGYASPGSASRVAEQMVEGGVDIIQLRAKKMPLQKTAALAAEIFRLTSEARIPLVINDHAEIVRDGFGNGVHLGQEDISTATARSLVRRKTIVGKSTHSVAQAVAAEKEGADYIGFGPLFATPTKPDYSPIGLETIRDVHSAVTIPIFCIGGIKLKNLEAIVAAGARRIVIVSELLQSQDIEAYAKTARSMLPAVSEIAFTK